MVAVILWVIAKDTKSVVVNVLHFKHSKMKDYSHFNVMYRKEVYDEVKPIVYGNNYMLSFYNQSFLLRDYDRKEQVYPLVNNDFYYQRDITESRKQFGIEPDKSLLYFWRSKFGR